MFHANRHVDRIKQTVDIRELGPDDAAAYKEMRIEASADPSFGISPDTEAAYSVPLLRQALGQQDGSYVLGAFIDDEMIGIVGYGKGMKKNTGTLFGLYVAPSYRRQSIGRQLCQRLFERHPGVSIRLEVLRANLEAIELYRQLGFLAAEDGAETLVMIRPPSMP